MILWPGGQSNGLDLSFGENCEFNSTEASNRNFYPIFNKRFDHLETLLTVHRPKNVLSAGPLCRFLVPSLQSKCSKRTFILSQKYRASVSNSVSRFSYHSHLNVSQKTKTNINFRSQAWVRPPAKCWAKGFNLPHKYHAPNFYQRF